MVKDDTFLDGMMVKLFFSCLLLSLLSMSTCVNGQSHYPLTQIPTCGVCRPSQDVLQMLMPVYSYNASCKRSRHQVVRSVTTIASATTET
jgi:hypothetical protein